jgi:hypothetical protein
MCWTLNHENILEMAQGHISLSSMNRRVIGRIWDKSVLGVFWNMNHA